MINITDKSKCSGCSACFNICPLRCIEMIDDNDGFLYPQVQIENCINCGLCEKACPIIAPKELQNSPTAYAAYNTNDIQRLNSSSGGIFILLAEQTIKRHGVVFGACFNDKFQVVHSYTETLDDLQKFQGSKYVQSKIDNTYIQAKTFLDANRLVLFTGTPCQIGGLKSYLNRDYNNLICLDICCHGVPSPKVWQKYLSYREKCANSIANSISFRRKDNSWKLYSISFSFDNNTEYLQTYDKDLMMTAFLKNICLRPSCYNCSFKTLHRESDITLADFWGIQNILPEMDDDKGTSLLMVNSSKGMTLLNSIKEFLVLKETDIDNAIRFNPSMHSSVPYNPKRDNFFDDCENLEFDTLIKKYCSRNILVKFKKKFQFILSRRNEVKKV